MKRPLIRSTAFIRAAKKMLRKKPLLVSDIKEALEKLEQDAYHPYLKTHKLTGNLAGSWACSAGYDLRIVFSFVKEKDKEAILLETIGTHDEVY
ncbi:MAG: type II toxin-antitoxin system mRNA interferase toxin, RelE/StbE family [Chitinivibrionales bacterium]|nr:type II toxin-antitoxin system mRNA interferase toxin, RelE/StbE family [Chitinivibrionales bacterium]